MNKFLAIIVSILLLSPINAIATDSVENTVSETLPVVNTIDDDVEAVAENEVDYKVPIDKNKIVNKFLVAMGAVASSSLLIYFGLTAYNRIREKLYDSSNYQEKNISLETPDNYEDAVKVFLDKTNW